MKRKPVLPAPISELENWPTKRLLGRLRALLRCEESLALSDREEASKAAADEIEFKESDAWRTAYAEVKQALACREHIP